MFLFCQGIAIRPATVCDILSLQQMYSRLPWTSSNICKLGRVILLTYGRDMTYIVLKAPLNSNQPTNLVDLWPVFPPQINLPLTLMGD